VVLGLVLLGLLTVGLRYQSRRSSQIALEDSFWRLTYELKYVAKETLAGEPESALRIGLPADRPRVQVVEEEFIHRGLGAELKRYPSTGNRELILTTEHSDEYGVTAEFEIRLTSVATWAQQQSLESLSDAARARYLRSDDELPVLSTGVQNVVRKVLREGGSDAEDVQLIFEHCSNLVSPGQDDDGADNVEWALANKRASILGKSRAMVTLCRAARIPARLVAGFELRQTVDPRPHVWLEVFYDHRWVPFDPALGYARGMPINFIPIRRGGESVVRTTGAGQVEATYSIHRLPPAQSVLDSNLRRPAQIFNLMRLPVKMHPILSLMLLLPLGALVTTVFRNVIGIRTFGTFAPALLAMSFIYAAWVTGIVILLVVVITALVGRSFLERLHLLMVPRLSIVLTMIILCVVFCVSLLDYLDWTHSAQAVLLPLVILTILTERFHVTTEEDGMSFAIQLTLGTVIVASCCYLLLRWDYIGRLLLIYPEAHFFTIAVFILIGRYSGYRLSELWRFRELAKSKNS
jgi:transglutaminase-like putative cysteine protease